MIQLNERKASNLYQLVFLPDGLKRYVDNASRIVFFPPEYLAVPCLTIAGAGIGRSVALRINESWVESPSLFALVVGHPGTGKSAGFTGRGTKKVPVAGAIERGVRITELAHHLTNSVVTEISRSCLTATWMIAVVAFSFSSS